MKLYFLIPIIPWNSRSTKSLLCVLLIIRYKIRCGSFQISRVSVLPGASQFPPLTPAFQLPGLCRQGWVVVGAPSPTWMDAGFASPNRGKSLHPTSAFSSPSFYLFPVCALAPPPSPPSLSSSRLSHLSCLWMSSVSLLPQHKRGLPCSVSRCARLNSKLQNRKRNIHLTGSSSRLSEPLQVWTSFIFS